jgi:hypothetical protein
MPRFPVLLLLAMCITVAAQERDDSEYSDSYYQNRVVKFQKMKIGGITLMSGGIICSVIGIAMIASAGTASYEVSYTNGTRTESGDPVGGFGGVLTGFGIPMTVGGIVLATIGSKKESEAKNDLQQRGHSLKLLPGRNRIALSFTF